MINELTRMAELGTPFVFVKKGDGEMACMNGAQGANCDGHPYSKELGEDLKRAFRFLEGETLPETGIRFDGCSFVLPFEDQKNYNCLLHRTDNDLQKVKEFWMSVRNSEKEKFFIGPQRLKRVAGMLQARFFPIPLVNACAHQWEIKHHIIEHLDPDAMIIFSAGFLSKLLMHGFLVKFPRLTCIDAGSAFDPLWVGETRTVQASKEALEALYADILR